MGIKKFFENAKRVFLVAKKPDKSEYFAMLKITGIGILILGLLGFIILMLMRIFYSPL
jgi:protein transport protein SEC61 subunit gamma and related proteins